MKLHERLKELRTQRQLTLRELSERTELSVSYLSDIERGRTTPTLATLETLSGALDVTVIDFLSGVDFAGQLTDASLPAGLAELRNDPNYGAQLTPEWIETLSRIQMRGKRPETKDDWLSLFLYLKRILE